MNYSPPGVDRPGRPRSETVFFLAVSWAAGDPKSGFWTFAALRSAQVGRIGGWETSWHTRRATWAMGIWRWNAAIEGPGGSLLKNPQAGTFAARLDLLAIDCVGRRKYHQSSYSNYPAVPTVRLFAGWTGIHSNTLGLNGWVSK